ncbi:DCN1-like protein [Teleopsis dalmanni]|uniref:DCN1-like protein n=1 Tax=Teleopsis dalmanni TaxID=139649 RepID=UPI0018CF5E6B|nr:DCN1-like protein [Teleopsis dalmanni]
MYRLQNNPHRDESLVKMFISQTKTTAAIANDCLRHNDWNIKAAVVDWHENPNKYVSKVMQANINKMYVAYKDSGPGAVITDDNVLRLLDDLKLRADSMEVLVLAWMCRARTQCCFTKQEFVNGMARLEVENIVALRNKLGIVTRDIFNTDKFKDFYIFAFKYAKEEDSKYLDINSAIVYWHIILKKEFQLLNGWCQYIKERDVKCINLDTWKCVLDFVKEIHPTLDNYSMDDAWPTLIDEFVCWYREHFLSPKSAQNGKQDPSLN